ncbi:MAG: hypothetical protein HYW22_00560 [Candidatus Aenigmarchaeota archaeon]|nr:hypothetical protein [Candidatus Aenigmarchaeota archaeon]
MPRVISSTRTLTNPVLIDRLLFVLLPLLDDRPFFPSRENKYAEMFRQSQERVQEKPIGALKLGHDYHAQLKDHIGDLVDKVVIHTTGVSVDYTQGRYPRHLGIDPMSERNRLYAEIQSLMHKIGVEWKYDGEFPKELFVWIPVAHEVHPLVVRRDDSLQHAFPTAVKHANSIAEGENRKTFGDLKRELGDEDFKKGNYLFSPALFDVDVAKRFYLDVDEGQLQTSLTFNRYLLGNAFAKLMLKYLEHADGIKGMINIYSERGSYAYDVMKIAQTVLRRKYGQMFTINDFGGIMRNAEMPQEAEAHISSLRILEGAIKSSARKYAR